MSLSFPYPIIPGTNQVNLVVPANAINVSVVPQDINVTTSPITVTPTLNVPTDSINVTVNPQITVDPPTITNTNNVTVPTPAVTITPTLSIPSGAISVTVPTPTINYTPPDPSTVNLTVPPGAITVNTPAPIVNITNTEQLIIGFRKKRPDAVNNPNNYNLAPMAFVKYYSGNFGIDYEALLVYNIDGYYEDLYLFSTVIPKTIFKRIYYYTSNRTKVTLFEDQNEIF